ncbi:MAG: AP2 domain-containing protein [Verrucomicrobiales bacterium]|nr:AP2 domain-containing protein [Verrucomicrobiales bacterium]
MSTPRPNYGITRIDQVDKKNHGYYVRITHKGQRYQKYFPDKSNGGKAKALRAAKAYRDEILAKLPKDKQDAASRKKRRIKKSGITGVTHVVSKSVKGKNYDYWQAAWVDESNRRKTAKFSIARYGEEKALKMAKKARREGVSGQR